MTTNPTRRLLTDFDLWHRKIVGFPAFVVPTRDGPLIGAIVRVQGEAVTRDLLAVYFESRDPYIRRLGYSVERFTRQVPKLLRDLAWDRRAESAPHPVLEALATKLTRHQYAEWFHRVRVHDGAGGVRLTLPRDDARWVQKFYAEALRGVEAQLGITIRVEES